MQLLERVLDESAARAAGAQPTLGAHGELTRAQDERESTRWQRRTRPSRDSPSGSAQHASTAAWLELGSGSGLGVVLVA